MELQTDRHEKVLKILQKYPPFREKMEEYFQIIEKYPPLREHMLEMLHDIQDHEPRHYLPREALQAVAEYLDLTVTEVASTVSFYTMFSLEPRGKHIIRVCVSPPCQAMGGSTTLVALKDVLGVSVGETTPDGLFTLETTSCLGVCGVAPAMMIDNDVYGNLTEERIQKVIDEIRRRDAAH